VKKTLSRLGLGGGDEPAGRYLLKKKRREDEKVPGNGGKRQVIQTGRKGKTSNSSKIKVEGDFVSP